MTATFRLWKNSSVSFIIGAADDMNSSQRSRPRARRTEPNTSQLASVQPYGKLPLNIQQQQKSSADGPQHILTYRDSCSIRPNCEMIHWWTIVYPDCNWKLHHKPSPQNRSPFHPCHLKDETRCILVYFSTRWIMPSATGSAYKSWSRC